MAVTLSSFLDAYGRGMKNMIATCIVLIAAVSPGRTQTPTTASTSEQIAVTNALNEMRSGLYTGFAEKTFQRLGDSLAIQIVHSYPLQDLKQEELATAVAKSLEFAFKNPELISRKEDRDGRVTVLLLSYLRLNTASTKEGFAIKEALRTVAEATKTR